MPIRVDSSAKNGPQSRFSRVLARLRAYPYLHAFNIIVAVLAVLVMRKKVLTEFEWAYVLTARHFLAGRGMYGLSVPPFHSFTYPPFMAVLAIPFVGLNLLVGRAIWYLVNAASLLVVWCVAWKLAGGGRLQGVGQSIDRREHIVAALGLALGLPFLLSGMDHQQTDILIGAMLMLGALALTRSRSLTAASSFGVAAGMKCTPLLWGPYLVWRGRFKAAFWLGIVAIGINFLPDLIRTPNGGGLWLTEWFGRFLQPMGRSDAMPGKWYAWILDNQSLAGAATRWATTRLSWTPGGLEIVDRPTALLSAKAIKLAVYAVELTLLLFAAIATRPRRDMPQRSAMRLALEFSLVLSLMLLLSPMSSRPHFATLLLPALCLARLAVYGKDRVAGGALLLAILSGLSAAPLWGRDIARLSLWCGSLSGSAAFLFAGCVGVLFASSGIGLAGAAREGSSSQSEPVSESRQRAVQAPHLGKGSAARR